MICAESYVKTQIALKPSFKAFGESFCSLFFGLLLPSTPNCCSHSLESLVPFGGGGKENLFLEEKTERRKGLLGLWGNDVVMFSFLGNLFPSAFV